jgi:hypothetical protein
MLTYMREIRNAYKIFVSNPEGNRPVRKPRCRCEGSIRMDLWERGWDGVDSHVTRDIDQWQALMNMVNLWIP